MKPILFEPNTVAFTTNGLGRLADCISCAVQEVVNGIFELEMVYPVTGVHYSLIQEHCIIYAIHDATKNKEPFEIYRISRPINGKVTVNAWHASYILRKKTCAPFSATSLSSALIAMKNSIIGGAGEFTFTSNFQVDNVSIKHDVPVAVKSLMGGMQGSIIDTYGGEWEYNNFECKLMRRRGQETGVSIRYGKNLKDIKKTTDVSDLWTGIVPYWSGMDDNNNEVHVYYNGVIYSSARSSFPYDMVIPVDASSYFDSQPNQSQLLAWGQAYVSVNAKTSIPASITISFVELWQTEEYKNFSALQEVDIGDSVNVYYSDLGVNNTARVVSYKYNVLLERYDSMTLGNVRASFTAAIKNDIQATDEIARSTRSAIERMVAHQTDLITGGLGGYVVLGRNANGQPEEILIMDDLDKTQAENVWRWNMGGLGYGNSYNGPFDKIALTADGKINASMITTGALNAGVITAGILKDEDSGGVNYNYWNLETGEFKLSANALVGNSNISDYVVGAVNVGARNLLRGTAKPVANTNVKLFNATANNDVITLASTSTSGAFVKWIVDYLDYSDYKNSEYTLSLDAMIDSNGSSFTSSDLWLYIGVVPASRIQASSFSSSYDRYRYGVYQNLSGWTTWQRRSVTFKVPNDLTQGNASALVAGSMLTVQIVTGSSKIPVKIRHIQLEKGNKATSWSVAPEDVDASISDAVTTFSNSLNQQEVYNRLTNNSQNEGIYLTGGHLYLNASMINTGKLSADYIEGGFLTSNNGYMSIDLTTGDITYANGGTLVMTSDTDILYIRESRLEGYYKKNESTTEVRDGILDLSAQTLSPDDGTTIVRDVSLQAFTHNLRLGATNGAVNIQVVGTIGKRAYIMDNPILTSIKKMTPDGQSTNENTCIQDIYLGYNSNGNYVVFRDFSGNAYSIDVTRIT